LLAACVRYQPLELKPEQLAAEFAGRSLDDPALRNFIAANHAEAPAPAGTWDFERLTLAAFYFSPALDLARADWAVARAGVKTARERPNPSVSLSPGYDATAGVPGNSKATGISPWILGYTFDIPIETAGKRRHRIQQAKHRSEGVRLNLAGAAWEVRSSVRRALIELQSAREAAQLWRLQEPLLSQAERLVAAQTLSGEIAPTETARARVALDQARLSQHDAALLATQAQSLLAEAIGIPSTALDGIELSFRGLDQAPPKLSMIDARRLALTNRADLLAALAEFAAADEAFRLELAKQYPDVHLTPGYTFDQGEEKWLPAISFPVPIMNHNRGPIAEARAARDSAAARFTDLQAHVLAQVDQASAAYGAALASRAPLESLRSNIDRQVRIATAAQKAGELSRLELSDALLDASRNTLSLLDARTHTEIALAALEDATQSPLLVPAQLWSDTPNRSPNGSLTAHE
jgi:outer membrane protein TolC